VNDLMKLGEVARWLGVSEKTVRRYVKSGELPSVFVGNAYRISEEDIAEYLKRARVRVGDAGPKAEASPESGEERRPKIVTGSANLKGSGTLEAAGDIVVDPATLGDILWRVRRRETHPDEALAEARRAGARNS
jgi:excisionase family DNA binding protein